MTRKEHHMAGKGISIIGSGVVGQATGIGLYATAETIIEAVSRSYSSMTLVPTHTVDMRIGLPYVKVALDLPKNRGRPDHNGRMKIEENRPCNRLSRDFT